MTIAVDLGRKATKQTKQIICTVIALFYLHCNCLISSALLLPYFICTVIALFQSQLALMPLSSPQPAYSVLLQI